LKVETDEGDYDRLERFWSVKIQKKIRICIWWYVFPDNAYEYYL